MSVASLVQLRWDLAFLAENQTVRSKRFGIPREAKSVRYPIRLLRYWFGYHLLREEAERKSSALEVAEIGVHSGQMLEFVRSAPGPLPLRKWTAVDTVMLWEKLRKAGYDDFLEANLENASFELPGRLRCGSALAHSGAFVRAGGRPPKGSSTDSPRWGAHWRLSGRPGDLCQDEGEQDQATAASMGHVSVFSPARVRRMAKDTGLRLEFISGAFFVRSKGSPLENSALWARFNLLWGAIFPGWPGEIYWLMRKPA